MNLVRAPLDRRRAYKPLDVGNGIVSGTLSAAGRWLSAGIAHPRHGRVVVTDAPPFDEARRRDASAVRAYRASLAIAERPGFGLDLADRDAIAFLAEGSLPLAVIDSEDAQVEVFTFAPPGRRGMLQVVELRAKRDLLVEPRWTGTMRLGRASYTQLTEGGPLTPAPSRPEQGAADGVLWLLDASLGAAVAVALDGSFGVAAGETRSYAAALALGLTRDDALAEARALVGHARVLLEDTVRDRRSWWRGFTPDAAAEASPVRRAVAYAMDCAATLVDDAGTAVLADHELLPLVWTRDAYYVCRLLLAVDPRGRGAGVVASFLRWCFETAERPDGWWPRASLASGQAKDRAFQLDQQLYPLLLLRDHARLTGDDALFRRHGADSERVLRALLERRSSFGLVATAETPADDPLDRPFHFSSHVLLWHVMRDAGAPEAEAVHRAVNEHFAEGDLYAYAVRGPRGSGALLYHDANDLPTVFAPGWGFCAPDDERWRATIRFAWSANNRAFVPGAYGGLGSVHTLHPWPLGDLQRLVVGRVLRAPARVAEARARLRLVATWDGMLPEAYDEHTHAVASRHWFAWPVALWGLLEHDPALLAP